MDVSVDHRDKGIMMALFEMLIEKIMSEEESGKRTTEQTMETLAQINFCLVTVLALFDHPKCPWSSTDAFADELCCLCGKYGSPDDDLVKNVIIKAKTRSKEREQTEKSSKDLKYESEHGSELTRCRQDLVEKMIINSAMIQFKPMKLEEELGSECSEDVINMITERANLFLMPGYFERRLEMGQIVNRRTQTTTEKERFEELSEEMDKIVDKYKKH